MFDFRRPTLLSLGSVTHCEVVEVVAKYKYLSSWIDKLQIDPNTDIHFQMWSAENPSFKKTAFF